MRPEGAVGRLRGSLALLTLLTSHGASAAKGGGRYRRIQRLAAQQRPHHNLSNTDYHSVGKLEPLSKVFDMAERGAPRKVAAQRSYRGEVILFTSDASMAGWSFHFVTQLRARGYEHWLILADKKVRPGSLAAPRTPAPRGRSRSAQPVPAPP